ncbi:MAG: CCA tRNA nucleotidyltransferase [Candidatus Saliniplasma sp.]
MRELEQEVLDKIKPKKELKSEVKYVSSDLKKKIEDELNNQYEAEVVGSVAKDTYLKDPDIDVFVLFPTSVSKDQMESMVLKVGNEILENTETRYAEHPYIFGRYEGFKTDIVPCYKISDISEMKSSVDRTPFHTEYISGNLPEDLKDHVRLLKGFLKGIGAYGAESKVWGFSGYLCELLVLYYGGFNKVLEGSQGWKSGEVLSFDEDNTAEFDDPFIFIDPVDPDRNVASALSSEKMYLFMYASKRYLDSSSERFFFPNDIKHRGADELRKITVERGTYLIGLKFSSPDVVKDNLYPQVQKATGSLKKQLEELDFEILHEGYYVKDEYLLILFEMKEIYLPSIEKHVGPPIWVENTEDFNKKYGNDVYLEGDRLMVDRERNVTTVQDAVQYVIKKVNLGSDLTPIIKENLEILEKERLITGETESLNKFLDRTFPWER